MPEKVEVFVSSDGPIRLKVPWTTFIKFARESLSISFGKELVLDENSFVKEIAHEGECLAWDLPEHVYLAIKEESPSHDAPNH